MVNGEGVRTQVGIVISRCAEMSLSLSCPCVLQAGIIVAVVAWHAADVINVTIMPLHAAGGCH